MLGSTLDSLCPTNVHEELLYPQDGRQGKKCWCLHFKCNSPLYQKFCSIFNSNFWILKALNKIKCELHDVLRIQNLFQQNARDVKSHNFIFKIWPDLHCSDYKLYNDILYLRVAPIFGVQNPAFPRVTLYVLFISDLFNQPYFLWYPDNLQLFCENGSLMFVHLLCWCGAKFVFSFIYT